MRKGDIIEYAYSVKGHNEVFGNYFSFDLWFAYTVPVGRIKRRLLTDPTVQLSIENKNGAIDPYIKEGKIKTYTWQVNNVQPVKIEGNEPSWFFPYPEVQVSNFQNWEEVKKWFSTIFTVGNYDVSSLKQLADSIKTQYPDDQLSQVTAMVDFTQKHIRYAGNENGIYSHKPHSPDYVLENMYGDCKDKSLFLHEFLKQINIRSYLSLINTTLKRSIKTENPSLNVFNHCVLAIEQKDNLIFIDPTIDYQGGNFLKRKIPNYEAAFLINHSETLFTDVPIDIERKIDIKEVFDVADNGDALLTIESNYSGTDADNIRNYILSYSVDDMQENYRSFYLKYADEVEVTDSIRTIDSGNNEITVSEQYRLKKFWTKSDSNSTKVTKEFIPYELNEKILYVSDIIRKFPLHIRYPVNIHEQIIVKKAEGWSISDKTITENNKFFNYKYELKVENNALILNYDYQSKTNYVAVEDYLSYKSKADIVSNNMVMSVESNDINKSVYGFNWLLLATMLSALIVSIAVCLSLYSKTFPSEFEKRHDSIGGWLILVALGIFITPVVLTYSIYKQNVEEFTINYYFYFFNESSDYFHPLKGYYVIASNVYNIFLIVASILLIIVFVQRKNSFRYYYSGYRLFNIIFLSIDLLMIYLLADGPLGKEEKIMFKSETADLVKIAVQTCIWVPYLWISERSKHTFVGDNYTIQSNVPVDKHSD